MTEVGDSKTGNCYCEDNSNPIYDASNLKCLWENETLNCCICCSKIHIKCLKSPTPSTLINDFLYEFTCIKCTGKTEEDYVRPKKLKMVYVVTLLLHNLQTSEEGRGGYFHYKNDIYKLFLSHRSHLLPSSTGNVAAINIASACSSYSGSHFISGSRVLGESGFWKLDVNSPPFLSKTYATYGSKLANSSKLTEITADSRKQRQTRSARKKKRISDDFVTEYSQLASKKTRKPSVVVPSSPSVLNVSSCNELPDNMEIDVDTIPEAEVKSPAPELPHTELDSDFEFINKIKTEALDNDTCEMLNHLDNIKQELSSEYDPDQSSSSIADVNSGIDIDTSALYNELVISPSNSNTDMKCEPSNALSTNLTSIHTESLAKVPETLNAKVDAGEGSAFRDNSDKQHSTVKQFAENEPDSQNEFVANKSTTNEMVESKKTDSSNEIHDSYMPVQSSVRFWTAYEENKLLLALSDHISSNDKAHVSSQVKLLKRMLHVRKVKRSLGIQLFDISSCLSKKKLLSEVNHNDEVMAASAPLVESSANLHTSVLDRFQSQHSQPDTDSIPTFISKLHGCGQQFRTIRSSYTERILKPYIWRDKETKPLKLKILDAIRKHRKPDDLPQDVDEDSIDYKYVTAQHIPVINRMCHRAFWPSIDLSECLQYPDFSCVAMYKRLVIGFAFMVPDVSHNEAYISFIYTHPEWRGAGIAKVMVYHLIQTCMGKDVTLHVSMTNPAIGLYLKFGFKVVEIIRNFYDKYHPIDSKQSPHAFYMKLERY